ncbi:hypothetical protein BaRGS_00032623, partial [Batillaria attramentaria]
EALQGLSRRREKTRALPRCLMRSGTFLRIHTDCGLARYVQAESGCRRQASKTSEFLPRCHVNIRVEEQADACLLVTVCKRLRSGSAERRQKNSAYHVQVGRSGNTSDDEASLSGYVICLLLSQLI